MRDASDGDDVMALPVDDSVSESVVGISISPVSQDSRIAISDSAVFRLIPVAATEV